MASLVDTNILVYRCDPRYPEKQKTARALLRQGLVQGDLQIPHQALVEFIAVVTRVRPGGDCLLRPHEASRQAEELMAEFPVLYPTAQVVRTALRGSAILVRRPSLGLCRALRLDRDHF